MKTHHTNLPIKPYWQQSIQTFPSMKKPKNIDKLFRFLPAINGTFILIVAAFLIAVSGGIQYYYTRTGIHAVAEDRARIELKVRNLEIGQVTTAVESSVRSVAWTIEQNLDRPDSLYAIIEQLPKNNSSMVGCAVAFVENYYPQKGRWYEPYVAHRDNGNYEALQIGSANHDYFSAQWYIDGINADDGYWTEPYLDEDGAQTTVCSYTYPIRDRNGRTVAIIGADISLEWLSDLFSTSRKTVAVVLASRNGKILACPDKNMVMKTSLQEIASYTGDTMVPRINQAMLAGDSGDAKVKGSDGKDGYVFYTPVEGGTGWSMAVYIPDETIYGEINKLGTKIFIFQIVGLALLGFILWQTIRGGRKLARINAEKQSIAKELRIASAIQMGMLPKTFPPYPDLDEVSMAGLIVPAKTVGGDLYDLHVNNGKLYFCIGDVSGKGVPASLVMAVTRSLFRTVSAHCDRPDRIMTQINDSMSEMNESSMFVTMFIGVLDLRTGVLSYSNAGHCPPIVITDKNESLNVDTNIPVGVMPDWNYTYQETTLQPGSRLFLYTDGLTEAENADHQLFGEERMMQNLANAQNLTPKGMITTMSTAVKAFVGKAEQSDDLTMLTVLFLKTIPS